MVSLFLVLIIVAIISAVVWVGINDENSSSEEKHASPSTKDS